MKLRWPGLHQHGLCSLHSMLELYQSLEVPNCNPFAGSILQYVYNL